ncbi:hypothetical protein LTR37_009297 [Vermiconidia calcicola]|uniref:Uncharacterized protein n=1 Tax=Vermiconidia calcicola TaxID=1690605 RepID=A0ACC3N872_9PEZI|nr:hypothetical protein LTR37_009297 [Vermiconidia calcicola]
MAAAVGKFAANKLLKKEMAKYREKNPEGGHDPYFAYIEDPRKPGKMKKVKKTIPAYIPEHDAEILAKVRRRAYRLDMCLFNFLGIRFGWEAVIGFIPVAGDVIGVLMSLMLFKKCCSVEGGLSQSTKMKMLSSIVLDFVVGLIPFFGDIADAAYKCNTRILRELEVDLDRKYAPDARSDERRLAGVDREKRRKNRASGIFMPDDPPPATTFEEYSDDELREGHGYDGAGHGVQQPPPAYNNSTRRGDNVGAAQTRQQTGQTRR